MKYPSSNLTSWFTLAGSRASFTVSFFPFDWHLRITKLTLSATCFIWSFFSLKQEAQGLRSEPVCMPNFVSTSLTVLEILFGEENQRWLPGSHIGFWITSKFKLDLYLFAIHLRTKYHFNISNSSWDIAWRRKSKMAAWQPYWISDRLQIQT